MDDATKAGARHSANDQTDLQAGHDLMVRLGAVCGGDETKSFNLDQAAQRVRDAWCVQYVSGPWLLTVFDDYIIVTNGTQQLYRVSYTPDLVFAPMPEWVPVRLEYLPIEADETAVAQDPPRYLTEEDIRGFSGKSSPDDTMIYAGDAAKSMPGGHVGGYLVRFSTPNDPDLAGEYFTKDTDFGIKSGDATHVWFHHRGAFKTRDGRTLRISDPIGGGTLKIDDIGVFVDAVLYNRAGYEQVLDQLGWSSGTASHLVDIEPQGKAAWIKRWYLGLDATLTFGPCEPRNAAIPLKSLAMAEMPEAIAASPSFDTKSDQEIETVPETGHDQPVVSSKALVSLVTIYTTVSEHTIKSRGNRLRRNTHHVG